MQKTLQQTPENAAVPEKGVPSVAPKNTAAQERTFISRGQKFHKWTTYLGIDWILNATFGVSFSYWGKYSKMGQEKWSRPLTEFFTEKLRPYIKDPVSLAKSADKGNMFMSIIAGGMFTIPPLMVMESRPVKKALSKKYDEIFYGKEVVASDPKFKESYDRIDDQPKKSFITGMISRFIALAPLLAMVLHERTREFSDKIYFNHISSGSETVSRAIGFGPQSFKKVSEAEAKERWKFIHDNVAMDAGLSLPYAGMHAVTYNAVAALFSRWFGRKKDTSSPDGVHESSLAVSSGMQTAEKSLPASQNPMTKEEEAARTCHCAREAARRKDEAERAGAINAIL